MSLLKYIPLQTKQASAISEANILCLGNFDGVHAAHRTLLRSAKTLQTEKFSCVPCGVFCFEKPSIDFLFASPPKHLTTLEQKLHHFASEGMDFAIVADFPALLDLSPQAFIEEILIKECACVAAVCGYNYHFGKNGAGTPALLQKLLGDSNVIITPPIVMNEKPVSSTRIRELLKNGKVAEANELLTVPFSITAPVEHGKGLGKHLGAPTFNQTPPFELLIPHCGVYLTRCIVDKKVYYGLTNIGTHPTVDANAAINLETHLLDFHGDLYQRNLTVEFLDFLRPEQRFASVKELQKQIQQDILMIKNRL